MNVLFLLVPLALILAALGVWGFIWAVRRGQFDDVHTPAMRMLVDDGEEEAGDEASSAGRAQAEGATSASDASAREAV